MIKRLTLMSLLLLAGCGKREEPTVSREIPRRIISLAPNVTETLYALGLERYLVGVTMFCTYPPSASDRTIVGGYGHFSYESIVSLQPDLVIVHEEFDAERERLERLGIPYLATGSYTVLDILTTIQAVGRSCGAGPAADELVLELNNRMEELTRDPENRPQVLIAFGGNADEDIGQVHAFGRACLHNELLEMAGGENILTGQKPYALLSKEAVLRLDPDVIIVLAPELIDPVLERSSWERLTGVQAVESDQVYILTNDYTCIPGPRFIKTLEDFYHILDADL
jgi:iron complex transport system substrate-binding protein